MGHAGSTGSITLDVYSKSWWDERVEAVSSVVEAVFAEPDEKADNRSVTPLKDLPDGLYTIVVEKAGYLTQKLGPIDATQKDVNLGAIGMWRG